MKRAIALATLITLGLAIVAASILWLLLVAPMIVQVVVMTTTVVVFVWSGVFAFIRASQKERGKW